MYARLTLNCPLSQYDFGCLVLQLLCPECHITGMCHHVLLIWLRDGTQGFVHARKSLHQLHCAQPTLLEFLDVLSNTWVLWGERCG